MAGTTKLMKKLLVFFLIATLPFVIAEEEEEEEEGDDDGDDDDGLSLTALLVPKLVIALCGVGLNVGVIIYFIKRRTKLNLSQRLLLSLAVADLLFTMLTLLDVLFLYLEDKHDVEIKDIASFSAQLLWFSVYSAMFHVLLISFDRLLAVSYPFKYKMMIQRVPYPAVIFATWLSTAIMQTGIALFNYRDGIEEGHKYDQDIEKIAGGIIFTTGIILVLCYTKIIYTIISYARKKDGSASAMAEVHACLIALVVTAGYIVFTFPVAIHGHLSEHKNAEKVYLSFQCLLLFNSVFNPLVYFWRGLILKCIREQRISRHKSRMTTISGDTSMNSLRIVKNSNLSEQGINY